MRVSLLFAWYDLWVGVYYARAQRRLYILPFPMFGIIVSWPDDDDEYWTDWADGCDGCTMTICGACGRPK